MSISLYEVFIPNCLQTLGAVTNILQKGSDYAAAKGKNPDDLLHLSLHETMKPLSFQLNSVMHHSFGAIKGVQRGEFNPPLPMDESYADFQRLIGETSDQLASFSPEEINQLADKAMKFKSGNFEMPFIAKDFLLSFSFPNIYFHATTAYDLLRMEGVELTKGDYMGKMRMNK